VSLPAASARPGARPQRLWPVVVAVQLGVLLGALEATIVGTAMPTLVAAVGGVHLYPWIFAAYMLASTVFMPVFGGVSDRLGRKGPYLAAVVVFALGAFLAGAAPSMGWVIAGRALQGIGAGGLHALSLIIFGDLFAGPRRGQMQAALTGVWGFASLVGPLIGGVIVDGWGWRWVFFLNLPLAALVAGLIAGNLRETGTRVPGRRLDLAGVASFVVGMTALLFAGLLPRSTAAGPGGLGLRLAALSLAVVALGLLVVVERRVPDPILPPALFRDRGYATSGAAAFFTGGAMFGALIHVPLLIQWGQGTDATTAGLALMTMSGGWSVGGLVAGQAVNRLGFRVLTVGGLSLMTLGYLALALSPEVSWRILLVIGGAVGMGMGLNSVTLILMVQATIPRERRGMATAGILFFRNVGATMGVAAMGALLTARLGSDLDRIQADVRTAAPALAALLVREIGLTFWLGAAATLAALVATILTRGPAPGKEAMP
jgi:MFS family permease